VKTSIFTSYLEGVARVWSEEKTGAKVVEIMAIIGPLVACKNLGKFSRDSADLAILQGLITTNPAINKNN